MKAFDRERLCTVGKGESAGFALAELLVIIAVVGILVGLQCAALAGGRGRSLIVECASHLRQYDLSAQLYANDHADHLPAPVLTPPIYARAGNWPWDLSVQVVNQITPYGTTRNVFYCPAHAALNNDTAWDFGVNGSQGGFRITGYVATFKYTSQVLPEYLNATLTPQSFTNIYTGMRVAAPIPSQRVLLADVTLSYDGNYNQIPIGGLPTTITQRTSHLDGKYPLGGNLAMLDGHVEWCPISDMKVAFGVPTFHW